MATPKQYLAPGAGIVNETQDVDQQYLTPGAGILAEAETGGGEPPEPPSGDGGLFFCHG